MGIAEIAAVVTLVYQSDTITKDTISAVRYIKKHTKSAVKKTGTITKKVVTLGTV